MEPTTSEYVAYYSCHMEQQYSTLTLIYKKISLKQPTIKPSSIYSGLGYASKSNKD